MLASLAEKFLNFFKVIQSTIQKNYVEISCAVSKTVHMKCQNLSYKTLMKSA